MGPGAAPENVPAYGETLTSTTDSHGRRAFFLRNNYSKKCIGVASSLKDGAGAIQYTCNGAVDEKWWYKDGAIVNVYSGKCLGVASSRKAGQQLIQWPCYRDARDEKWRR
ncbi:RICIN domain-containing protein [Nonomuraea sp. NEAU-L178]|nr:RICIN domain-containing protein [Nonomuraea aurantiaca]